MPKYKDARDYNGLCRPEAEFAYGDDGLSVVVRDKSNRLSIMAEMSQVDAIRMHKWLTRVLVKHGAYLNAVVRSIPNSFLLKRSTRPLSSQTDCERGDCVTEDDDPMWDRAMH